MGTVGSPASLEIQKATEDTCHLCHLCRTFGVHLYLELAVHSFTPHYSIEGLVLGTGDTELRPV